jgi:hypothetical protein
MRLFMGNQHLFQLSEIMCVFAYGCNSRLRRAGSLTLLGESTAALHGRRCIATALLPTSIELLDRKPVMNSEHEPERTLRLPFPNNALQGLARFSFQAGRS